MSRKCFLFIFALALASPGVCSDVELGPSGGSGGTSFKTAAPQGARIVEVRIWSGSWIDSIQLVYETPDGKKTETRRYGGRGGDMRVLKLEKGDSIRSIQGKYAERVDSIAIQVEGKKAAATNFHAGGRGGRVEYSYEAPAGTVIVGFKGRFGEGIDSIGVILRKQ